jgi:hypothetical protein
LRSYAALLLPWLIGCATSVTLDPEAPDVAAGRALPARIDYPGNRDHLPATVTEAEPDVTGVTPVVVYRTETHYAISSPLQILNPLLMVGFRGIGADVIVDGRLEVRNGVEVVKRYQARCVVKMRRSVWRWHVPSQTDLRAKGLVAVRELIEAQMVASEAELEPLRSERKP